MVGPTPFSVWAKIVYYEQRWPDSTERESLEQPSVVRDCFQVGAAMTRSGRSVLLWPGQSMAGHKQSVHPRGTAEDRISDTWRPAHTWHAKRCHQKHFQRIRWSHPAPGARDSRGQRMDGGVPAGTEAHNAKFDSSAAGPLREEHNEKLRQGRRTINACPNRQSFQTSRVV